jgi:hypothetical protein
MSRPPLKFVSSRAVVSLVAVTTAFAAPFAGAAIAGTDKSTVTAVAIAPSVMVYSVTATPVSEFTVSLPAGVPVTFRTTDIFDSEDPVLHLFSPSGAQVAAADNGGGGRASLLSYTPPSSGTYHLMVRSRTPASFGLADVLMNNQPWKTDVPFAGAQVTLSGIRTGEQLQTTVVTGGVNGPHRLYVLGADGVSAIGRNVATGPNSGTRWSAPTAISSATVVIGSPPGIPGGPVRFTRNDVALSGHDADEDGLGDELEAKIGTCSTRSGIRLGFDCARAADAADTDGDGISDGWEFFGRSVFRFIRGPFPVLGGDYETLPKWGANPRHKDLFVEVDFMLRCPNEPAQTMTPATARSFASYYQDQIGNPTTAQQAAHAATLRNPDGQAGIAVHMDTGVAPETPADATTYGNWGGYTAVPRADPGSSACKGADYSQAWKTNMHAARRGIFRYALTYPGGGGQTGPNSFAFSGPMTNAATLAHESGHAMGLGHSGPAGATGFVDVNCKPNYPSLMNYAYLYRGAGFADGTGAVPLNNAALPETAAAAPTNMVYLDALEQVFGYWVNRVTGDVDWNRDGTIAPAGTTVRAYANYQPSGSCEYTRYNKSAISISSSESSRLSPAIARLNQRAYAFYVNASGALRYARSESEWLCPQPSATPCARWSIPQTHPLPAASGVDVQPIDSPKALLVVTVDSVGRLWESRLTTDFFSGAETWTTPALIPGSSPVIGEPSLARRGLCSMYLTYKTIGGELRHRHWSCSGGWQAEQRSLSSTGSPIVLPSYASPGTARGYLPSRPGRSSLLAAFANSTGGLSLWRLDETTNRWVVTSDLRQSTGAAEGRPALAWVPALSSSDGVGRLYVTWITHDTAAPAKRTVKMAMSYTKVTRLSTGELIRDPQVGLTANYDNVWLYSYGIDLLFEPGYDNNLISIQSRSSDTTGPTSIEVRPKADGINDFRYVNYDDWATLRRTLCRNVINPGGLGPNLVTCP